MSALTYIQIYILHYTSSYKIQANNTQYISRCSGINIYRKLGILDCIGARHQWHTCMEQTAPDNPRQSIKYYTYQLHTASKTASQFVGGVFYRSLLGAVSCNGALLFFGTKSHVHTHTHIYSGWKVCLCSFPPVLITCNKH